MKPETTSAETTEKMRSIASRAWPYALFFILTITMTWPHALFLGTRLPGRHGAVAQDALLNVWGLQQGVQNVLGANRGLFDSNAFWPHKLSLCFTDHLMGWWPFALFMRLFTDNFVFIYSFLLLSTFFLSACGAYLVALHLTGSRAGAVLAGVIFGFCPFRISQYGHFAGLSMQWMVFSFLFVLRYLKKKDGLVESNASEIVAEQKKPGSWRSRPVCDAVLAFVFLVLQTLCSGIYGLYFCVFLGLYLALRATLRKSWSIRGAATLVAWAAGLFVGLLPFYWPNLVLKNRLGFERTLEENVRLAADVLTILTPPENSMMYTRALAGMPPGEGQFPGVIVLLLAGYGCWALWKNGERETAILFTVCGLVCWVLSLGPQIKFNAVPLIPGPYALLMVLVPVFKVLRMSTRFGAFFIFSLSMLAAFGAKEWLRPRKEKRVQQFALMLLILCMEYLALPSLGPAPDAEGLPQVYQWMASQKEQKAVIELPYTHSYTDAFTMFFSMYHSMNLLNGYASFSPPEGMIGVMGLIDFPSPESVRLLQATGADWLVVRQGILQRPLAEVPKGLKPLARFGDDFVYEIQGDPLLRDWSGQLAGPYTLTSDVDPEALIRMRNGESAWPSAGFSRPGTGLHIKFPQPQRVSTIVLGMYPLADLMPCRFEVLSEGRLLKTENLVPEFYRWARKNPRRPILTLLVPEDEYSELVLRPIIRTGFRAWPIKDLKLVLAEND
ncbi:MAG: hypothetical protein O3B01_05395 [Planctomycetota bacterium]|nr:hypothetical protein [Planctomycetota bacterium]